MAGASRRTRQGGRPWTSASRSPRSASPISRRRSGSTGTGSGGGRRQSRRWARFAFFRLHGLVLGLWWRACRARDARLEDVGGWSAIALARNHESGEAVDAAVAAAVHAGATLLKAPEATEWGGYSGYVADPDGHPWEIAFNPSWPLGEDRSLQLPR